jgi:RNA polymerase sigma-70 factor (sigma-E family)
MNVLRWEAPAAFDDFVRSRHAALLRFAHVLCGDPHLAADLVQDALERTGLAWPRIAAKDDPEGYMRRTIVNRYLGLWRRRQRERVVPEVPEVGYEEAGPRDGALWQLLGTLPRQQRAVLVLRFYEDLSLVEIADVLGCSVGTVKSNSSRALAKLRQAMPEASMTVGQS